MTESIETFDRDTIAVLENQMKIRARKESVGINKALDLNTGETGNYVVKFSNGAVKQFKVNSSVSFDDLLLKMDSFNAKKHPIRCLSVTRTLRGVRHCVVASMENNIVPNCNIKAKNPVLSEIYCV
jgi:hypothetical protein